MCCLICCMCMKKEFDISCSIYQGQSEDSPPTPRKSNGKKTVIEKKQAVKGFVMRTMVRAATGIEGAKRN